MDVQARLPPAFAALHEYDPGDLTDYQDIERITQPGALLCRWVFSQWPPEGAPERRTEK